MAKAPAAVDPLDELRTVLEQCGIATQAAHNNLIANEGFTSIESMSCMTNDNDVNEMAKLIKCPGHTRPLDILGVLRKLLSWVVCPLLSQKTYILYQSLRASVCLTIFYSLKN
jgi:hypothetical protein